MTNNPATLRIGDWRLDPATGELARGGEVVRLEARSLRLLLELAAHAGETLSIDDLLDRVWAGVIVTPDSVYHAITGLRRVLGDDPRRPRYIATVPRLGYRLVAKVAPADDGPLPVASRSRTVPLMIGIAAATTLPVIAGLWLAFGRPAAPVPVGVMPFLDFSEGMDQVALVDQVTEGLVDDLAAKPGLKVPSFRAAFLLKGKHLPPAAAAKALKVGYLVEGAVRRSGDQVRVTARLVRADSGFVVWTADVTRPLSEVPQIDQLMAQGVATAVAR